MTHLRPKIFLALGLLAGSVPPATAEVVAVVSARSSITSLSVHQIHNIFLGKESRFPNGELAVPIDYPEGSMVRDEFYARYFDRTSVQIKSYWSKLIFTGKGKPPQVLRPGARLRKAVAENPNYIGYMKREDADESVKVVKLLDH